jgi:glycosyltransferase involved in cell wall biosynthesis
MKADAVRTRPSREALARGTWAVIPAYNAGAPLLDVARAAGRELAPERVLIVDDGSRDDAPERARQAGLRVIVHPVNRGKGAALATGFAAALAEGAAGVLTLDADGQHDPAWISGFLDVAPEADLVLGSRMKDPGDMPGLRVAVNRFTSRVVSALAGARITDSQSGFRWISAEVLRRVTIESERFDAESEILIKAARFGYRLREIPMPAVYGDEISKVHPLRDTVRFLRLVGRSLRWVRETGRLRRNEEAR